MVLCIGGVARYSPWISDRKCYLGVRGAERPRHRPQRNRRPLPDRNPHSGAGRTVPIRIPKPRRRRSCWSTNPRPRGDLQRSLWGQVRGDVAPGRTAHPGARPGRLRRIKSITSIHAGPGTSGRPEAGECRDGISDRDSFGIVVLLNEIANRTRISAAFPKTLRAEKPPQRRGRKSIAATITTSPL